MRSNMRKTFFLLALLPALTFSAPNLMWDASSGADGYNMYCGISPSPSPVPIDVGNVTTYDLGALVSAGTEYECWVTAYAAGFPESAESNRIRFTPPQMQQTLVVPGQPSNVTIQWQ